MRRMIAVLIALVILFAAVPVFACGSQAGWHGWSGHHYHFGWSQGDKAHSGTVTPPPPPPPPIVGTGKGGETK